MRFPLVAFIAVAPVLAAPLTVVSLNLAEKTDVERIADELQQVEAIRRADVFLLQEVRRVSDNAEAMPGALARALGLYCQYAAGDELENGAARGVAILSRYPLTDPEIIELDRHRLGFKNRRRIALGVTVNTPLGLVRVFNLHLDNRLNTRHKVEQLAPVLKSAAAFDGARIIGGDFNTGNILWLGHFMPVPGMQKQSQAVRELMLQNGYSDPFGPIGSTFDYFSLRLDWIWINALRPIETGVQPMQFSDHHAIWVKLAPANVEDSRRLPIHSVPIRRSLRYAEQSAFNKRAFQRRAPACTLRGSWPTAADMGTKRTAPIPTGGPSAENPRRS